MINFDLPQVAEDYVHRIGRTGRAGAEGIALSLVCADEVGQLHAIEQLIKRKLDRTEIDDFEPKHHLPTTVSRASRPPQRAPSKGKSNGALNEHNKNRSKAAASKP